VGQPLDKICKIALDSLINKITKADEKDYIYLLPTELILRETTEV
jgi:DNA-binding LacI/PurR family transcriptional regulator